MAEEHILDFDELVGDLRLAVAYAARAGLLREPSVLGLLKSADDTVAASQRDFHALTQALNAVAQLIAPMTVADLRFGRDPFTPVNQTRAHRKQLGLTFLALVVLVLIGDFMHALRQEKDALITLQQVETLKPIEKLTTLRKMAQYESPLKAPNALYDQFHQRIDEIRAIKFKIRHSREQVMEAYDLQLFPFIGRLQSLHAAGLPAIGAVSASAQGSSESAAVPDYCDKGPKGDLQLPAQWQRHPGWMQAAMADALNDFCFQIKVISPDDGDIVVSSSFSEFVAQFQSPLKHKISLRSEWFLPFFYGLLGSMLFIMRNVASVRTPSMEWFPIFMRVALGGVAGIVVGWFSISVSTGSEGIGTISLPFALAFLAGYGIEALFTVLDRLSRALGEPPAKA